MERFRELLARISAHDKEIQSAKKAGEDAVQKKDSQMKRVLRREAEIKKTSDEQKTIIKNLASIWKSRRIGQKYIRRQDQQRNLKLLEEAMKANEIPAELYQVIIINLNFFVTRAEYYLLFNKAGQLEISFRLRKVGEAFWNH